MLIAILTIPMRRYFNRLLIIVIVLLGATPFVYAQADTVHCRSAIYILNDSTQFGFQIGSIVYKHNGTSTYLHFDRDASGNLYFTSVPFIVKSGDDSISFCKSVSLDSKDFWQKDQEFTKIKPIALSNDLMELYNITWSVSPSDVAFDASSNVMFITELRSVMSNTLIASIDTIVLYRNGEGQLRWYEKPDIVNQRTISLSKFIGERVILTSRSVFQLPKGASVIHTNYDDLQHQSICYGAIYSYSGEDYPTPTPVLKWWHHEDRFAVSPIVNSATQTLKIAMICEHTGIVAFDIATKDEASLKQFKRKILKPGEDSFEVDIRNIAKGEYVMRVVSAGVVCSYGLKIE